MITMRQELALYSMLVRKLTLTEGKKAKLELLKRYYPNKEETMLDVKEDETPLNHLDMLNKLNELRLILRECSHIWKEDKDKTPLAKQLLLHSLKGNKEFYKKLVGEDYEVS